MTSIVSHKDLALSDVAPWPLVRASQKSGGGLSPRNLPDLRTSISTSDQSTLEDRPSPTRVPTEMTLVLNLGPRIAIVHPDPRKEEGTCVDALDMHDRSRHVWREIRGPLSKLCAPAATQVLEYRFDERRLPSILVTPIQYADVACSSPQCLFATPCCGCSRRRCSASFIHRHVRTVRLPTP